MSGIMMRPDFATRYGDERLPRYTSYPTSPHFSASVGASAYGRWLAEISPETTASLYLHIPFCRAMCWYCGCNTSVAKRDDIIETYGGRTAPRGRTGDALDPASPARPACSFRRRNADNPAAEHACRTG